MANIKDIRELVVHAFRGTSPDPSKFSNADTRFALSAELKEMASTYMDYQRNKLDLFQIIQESADEVLPRYVENVFGLVAETKTVAHGQKALFVRKRGRTRAKQQFITQVAASGVYEAFRLDKDTFELTTKAVGGAAYIDFERYLIGDENPAEMLEILVEGIQEAIMNEVQLALLASINSEDRPAKNIYVSAGFDPDGMQELLGVARSYGSGGAVIFAPPEFITAMGADAIGAPVFNGTPGYAGATPVYAPQDIDSIHNTGFIQTFRGAPIVQLPQSYTDETNEVTVINPGIAYIFPTGGEKIVKIVLEGDTIIDEFKNRDRSMEIEAYKKIGVGVLTHNNWCIYENTELTDEENYPTKNPV